MSWPTPQEYNEAIQNPYYNFSDTELKSGVLETNSFGLPKVASGSFASVYRVKCKKRDVAVRCFLRNTKEQAERYARISEKLIQIRMPHVASFDYLTDGIRVGDQWFPVMKMEWVTGLPLDLYVMKNAHDKQAILKLATSFRQLVLDLNKVGIAHGDLQHGNILITEGVDCRLVDYDGMFVPALRGKHATELGHRNYQHPARDHSFFDENLDCFSAWSIYTALVCVAEDPTLLKRLGGGDECLLFKQADYKFPLRSLAFFTLEAHDSPIIREAGKAFRSLLDRRLHEIPRLSEKIVIPETLPELTSVFTPQRTEGRRYNDYVHKVKQEIEQEERRNSYPRLKDYIHACTKPQKSFADAELKESYLALDKGIISPIEGASGAVFRFHTPTGNDLAVKVFFHPDEHREERYHLLSEFLAADRSELAELRKYLIQFEYQKQGILVNSKWFPIVIMEWVEGETLFANVDNLVAKRQRAALKQLSRNFKSMMVSLRHAGIVHGDIDSENIIVTEDGLKLTDYDLMRTPISVRVPISELSNKNFRHPKITKPEAENNDNFSSWVVYASLVILSVQPDLWIQAGPKPGRLLFRSRDLQNPTESIAFDHIENHYSHVVRSMGSQLMMFALWEPEHVPMLFQDKEPSALTTLSDAAMPILSGTHPSLKLAANSRSISSSSTKILIPVISGLIITTLVMHAWLAFALFVLLLLFTIRQSEK